jgi:hypothetical protein
MNRSSFVRGAAALLALTLLAGCSGGDGRIGISGTVTLDGKPLDNGSIHFEPTAENSAAPSSGGTIANGAYELPASSGLFPGEYKVVIQAVRKTGKQMVDLQTQRRRDELQPVPIREAGSLKTTVVRRGETRLNFAVTSSP